jgi:YD repeat-containing protein
MPPVNIAFAKKQCDDVSRFEVGGRVRMARFGHAASAVALLLTASTPTGGHAQQTTTGYTYDVHGRLVKTTRFGSESQYTYDRANNRTKFKTDQINHPPVANPDAQTVPSVGEHTFYLLANDTDPDSDPLIISAVSTLDTGKATIIRRDGWLTYIPKNNQSGVDSFTYTVSDGKGATATGTVTVTINSATQPPLAPVAGAFTKSLVANTGGSNLATTLPLNFSAGGAPASVAVYSAPAGGTGTASAVGTSIQYTPPQNWSGQTTLQYTGTNATGTSAPATGTIKVEPVVANVVGSATTTATTGPQISLPITPTTTNTSLSLVSGPATQKGSAYFTGNTLYYTPNAGAAGDDNFSYQGTSSGGISAPANIKITITSTQTPVVPNAVTFNTPPLAPNTSNSLPISFTGGTPTSVSVTSAPAFGTATPGANSITYTPPTNWSGQTSLQYKGTNAAGTGSAGTANIFVVPAVRPIGGTATAGGSQINIPLDPVTNVDTYTVGSVAPTKGTAFFNSTIGRVYYTPNANVSGSDTFTYRATTAGGTSADATVTINFTTQPNRSPIAVADYIYDTVTGPTDINVLSNDSDPDNDPLTIVGQSSYNNGTVTLNANKTLRYTPPAGFEGPDHIYYTITDGRGGTASGTAEVMVGPPANSPPVANPGSTTAWQNQIKETFPLANDTDADGDTLTLQSVDSWYFAYGRIDGVDLTAAPANIGSASKVGNSIYYFAPSITSNGATGSSYIVVVVNYTVSDGKGGTASSYETIPIYAPN